MAVMANPAFNLSQHAQLLRYCLAAGKSPGFYQREAALLGVKLRTCQRAADWVPALLDTKMWFVCGSLLGDSLARLTDALQQEVETRPPSASENTKREQRVAAAPSYKPKAKRALEDKLPANTAEVARQHNRSQRREQIIATPRMPSPTQKFPTVDHRVNQAFLSRLAGSSLKPVNSAPPSRNLRQMIARLEETAAKNRKRHFSKFDPELPAPSAATSTEAGAAFSLPPAYCDRVSLRLRQSNVPIRPHTKAFVGVAASLLQQWSASLNGVRATLALLRHLAGLASATAGSKNISASSHSPRTSNDERLARTTSGKVEKRAARQTNAETVMLGNPELLNEMREASPRNKHAITAPEIRSLPPLNRLEALPPSPFPSKRHNLARAEEPPAGDDDLEAFASKVKRILDDDARRHGIEI